MSCVVKAPDGSIKIYTKGADTVILERLRKHQQSVLDHTGQLLEVLLVYKF
jgi:magnesium-transporting ATPase (P-type)